MTNNPASTTPTPPLAEGQKLAGCYVLKTRLNGPGDAVIWCAEDEVLGKEVSLHFLPVSVLRDKIAMNALRQEVKRTRALIHPNILRVYDLVEEADWAAISMDTFAGQSLAMVLKEKGKLEPSDIDPWLGQLCQTLEEAHKINLIHRDLALDNVFIGGPRCFFLANFGISRVVQDALNRADKQGAGNPRVATLSPQLLDAQTPARTDDVYGVGALLFELLTGRPIFADGDMIQQIRTTVPPRVSEVRAGQGLALPKIWDETIAACLHKAAESRPQAPAQIAAKLAGSVPAAASKKPAEKIAERAVQTKPSEAPVVPAVALSIPAPKKKAADVLAERAAQFKAGDPSSTGAPGAAPSTKEPTDAGTGRSGQPTGGEGTKASEIGDAATGTTKKKAADILAERAAQFRAESATSGAAKLPEKTGQPGDKKAASKIEKSKTSSKSDSDSFLAPRQSRSPVGLVAVVAMLVVGGAAYYYHLYTKEQAPMHAEIATTDPREGEELTSVKNSFPEPTPIDRLAPTVAAAPPAVTTPAPEPAKMELPAELPVPAQPTAAKPTLENPAIIVAQNAANKRAPAPALTVPAAPVAADSKELADKAAALEKLKQEAVASEKMHREKVKQQQAAEAAVAETQKALTDKTKAAAPVRKAAEDLLAMRKKREDDQKTAEAAAQAAQQLALEKAKAAEEAKKALAEFDTQNKEKLAAQQQAETELQAMQQTLADRQKAAADALKAAADADTSRQQQFASIKQTEQDLVQARAAAEKAAADAEKKRLAMEGERRRLDDEVAAMRAMFEQKMKEIDERRRQLESPAPAPAPVPPTRTEKMPPSVELTPAATPAMTLAMKTEPEKIPIPEAPPEGKGPAMENSLGLKFAPVGEVFFSVWQTRVKDFETFAKAVNLRSNAWKSPGFRQGPEHPVVNVTWNEAIAFCKWLTDKERKEGKLPANQFYRLPSDLEWSAAVGLPAENGKTPEARDMGVQDVYPWGTDWPPPEGAGNYTGEETGSDVAIKGYNDKFPWTAPVGSFPSNKLGLYDMGGNVWQWCMDSWNNDSKAKVLRGASWYNGALKLSLLASCRVHAAPDSSTDNYGFRVVRAADGAGRSARRP